MLKKVFIIFIITLGAFTLTSYRANAAVMINENVQLVDDRITLGDIFTQVSNSHVVIAIAPHPGKTLFMRTNELIRIARKHDVLWSPSNSFKGIKITRIGKGVEHEPIQKLVRDSLKNRIDEDFDELEISLKIGNNSVVLPANGKLQYTLQQFSYSNSTSSFRGIVEAKNSLHKGTLINISGSANLKREIPVLRKYLKKGDLVGEADIYKTLVDAKQISDNVVSDPETLIGMQARQNLRSDKILYKRDLMAPIIVHKRKAVTLVYKSKILSIQTLGVANDDGALGDVVSVKNAKSGKIIEGIVVGQDTISVLLQGSATISQQ